ncbi:MAG: hypothetical protein STHCBS139747_003726 [Sporothrix thermara]
MASPLTIPVLLAAGLTLLAPAPVTAASFTIANGQIYTPGFAVVDSPQPGTPMGGDTLQIALDVTAGGRLPLPDHVAADSPSVFHNITMFLYSYDTQRNFTISNGTAAGVSALGPILLQEPGSTVKHVDWVWPDCFVGSGSDDGNDGNARGSYNISIRQNFRLNGQDHYTVFDLPIVVSNAISAVTAATVDGSRASCADLENPLLTPEQIDAAGADDSVGVLFAPGDATEVQVDSTDGSSSSSSSGDDGLGPTEPTAKAGDGLGSAGMRVGMPSSAVALLLCIGGALLCL